MPNQTIFHDIPRHLLAALLDREGPAGALSPRPLLGPAGGLNKHQLAELYAGHFVELPQGDMAASTPEFARAAQVMLNPLTNLTFRTWGDESACAETTVLFPGDPIEDGGLVVNQIDDAFRLVSPVGLHDVVHLVSPLLPPATSNEPVFKFEGHFDAPVAATLFGLVDLIRLSRSRANGYDADEISAALAGAWGLTGFRHLLSYVTVVGLRPTPPAGNEVGFALETLVAAKVVEPVGDNRFTLAQSLRPLVDLMPAVVPGLQWQRHTLSDAGEILTTHRVFVFGDDSLVLRFAPMPQGRIFVSTTTATALSDFVIGELSVVTPRAVTPRTVVAEPKITARPAGVEPAATPPPPIAQPDEPARHGQSKTPVLALAILTPLLVFLGERLGFFNANWILAYTTVSLVVGISVGILARRSRTRSAGGAWRSLLSYFLTTLVALLVFDVVVIQADGGNISEAAYVKWFLLPNLVVATAVGTLVTVISRVGSRKTR